MLQINFYVAAAIVPLPREKVCPVSSASSHTRCWFLFIFPPPTSFTRINQKPFIESFRCQAVFDFCSTQPWTKSQRIGPFDPMCPFSAISQNPRQHCQNYHTSFMIGFHSSLCFANFCHPLKHTSSRSPPVLHWPAGWEHAGNMPGGCQLQQGWRSMGHFSAPLQQCLVTSSLFGITWEKHLLGKCKIKNI